MSTRKPVHLFLNRRNHSLSGLNLTRPPPLSLMADRCTSMKQLKQVHAQMVVSDRFRDNYAASRIISFSALSPSGDLDYALRLFHHTQEPNSFMWNTIIRAHAGSPTPSEAVRFYLKMQRLGILPGKHTFPFLLRACTGGHALVSTGKQVHGHVLKRGLDFDLYVASGLIRCYASGGLVSDARQMFDEVPERNLIVWTTMVSGYAQNFCSNEALLLFDQMIQTGLEPNDFTLASVLSACARTSGLDVGERVHMFMREKGIPMGVVLGSALVDMYAKNGVISTAMDLFRRMSEKNAVTWNAMICGLALHGHAGDALDLFWELEKEELKPNDVTFVGVLSACCHAGMLEVGRRIFQSMEKTYGIEPKVEHFGCMVDLLGRCGRVAEAEKLMKGMRWEADVVVLGALLTACKKHGDVEIAERLVKQILELEPGNHSVYVILSNMYAEAGKWEDVARLREVMRDGGLKKIPGWSCVDGEGEGS